MNNKIQFRQLLSEISEIATVNGNKIKKEDVEGYLEDAKLSEEQLEMVYAYLEAEKITVLGHKPTENNAFIVNDAEKSKEEAGQEDIGDKPASAIEILDMEEKAYVDMYLEELNSLEKLEEQEIKNLCKATAAGDEIAKIKLIEGYLVNVVEIAKEYANRGVLVSDLIQEGNVGLMLAVDKIAEKKSNNYMKTLQMGVREVIESAIEEAGIISSASGTMVSKINYLNEGSKNLNEDLGRKATIEELARYMEMTEEEVADIIKIADDEIEVMENDGKKE